MSKTKEFIKNSGIYFTGKVLTLLITLLLLPLFTKFVSTKDYGNYELVRSFVDLLVPFLCAECWKAIFRLSLAPKLRNKKESLFGTSVYFCLFSDILVSIILFFLLGRYEINPILPVLLVFTETINFLFQYISRSLNKNLSFALSGIAGSLVNAITGLFCIFVFKNLRDAMLISLIASQVVQTIILFVVTKGWRFLSFKNFNFGILKDVCKFAWPFGLTTLVYYFSNGFNSFLIKTFLEQGSEKIAIYSIALKFIAVVTLFASVIEMSWSDILYKMDDEVERKQYMNKWLKTSFKFFAISGLLMLFAIKFLFPFLVGEDYQGAWDLVPILYVSSFFIMANNTLLNPCRTENKPWIFLVAKTINGIVSVSLFFGLFKVLDLKAVCIAQSAGLIFEYIAFQILDRKYLKLDFQILSPVLFVIAYAGCAFIVFRLSMMFCSIVFILLLVFSFLFTKKDLDEITHNKFKFLSKKIRFDKNLLAYFIYATVFYQIVFWFLYFVKINENTTTYIISGIVFTVLIVLLFIFGKIFKYNYSQKAKYCFWIFFGNLLLFGFIILTINEFDIAIIANQTLTFALICLVVLNINIIEIVTGEINEEKNK